MLSEGRQEAASGQSPSEAWQSQRVAARGVQVHSLPQCFYGKILGCVCVNRTLVLIISLLVIQIMYF